MIQTNLFTRQKSTHRIKEQTYGYQGEECSGGKDWEFGIDMYTLLYLNRLTKKNVLYSLRNSAQYSVITQMWKEFEKE